MNTSKKAGSAVAFLLKLLLVAVFITPFYVAIVYALKSPEETMKTGLAFPRAIYWQNFTEAIEVSNFWVAAKNSLIITVVQVALALFLSACVGYGFAMYNFKGKNILFLCVLLVMMIPTEVILLPLYRLIVKMDLINNMWGIILPYLVVPMLVFFFRQYLMGIPKDFLDAARVDGCTEYGIFFKIMIPLMKPSFAAMGIYQGMQSWNNFLWPMIVTNSIDKITLPVGLQSLLSPYGNNYDILIAGSCFAIIPILALFVCFQRYFIEGMTAGGVKG